MIRADTEATIGDLDLLNRINLHAKERYQAMANAAEGLQTDSEYLAQNVINPAHGEEGASDERRLQTRISRSIRTRSMCLMRESAIWKLL